MQFEERLTHKVLDPIHGIIRLTDLEIEFINHPLFQRLRNIKQNTFLYKVFPSAMHSRFEHSLGVMHSSYEILDNMRINGHRYKTKYHDDLLFSDIPKLPIQNVQELRLAALLHDIGHGPMSHQFDSFMCDKLEFKEYFGDEFPKIVDLVKDGKKVEHEHMSLLFAKIIYDELSEDDKQLIDIDNVLTIIDKDYKERIPVDVDGSEFNVLPLFTSIISSCPIDADRMDYLLRDSYFSGVKCGIYDHNRLFMSMVPIKDNDSVYLAYKESGLDSIVEFINSRSNLFGQVYYHKTNRSFSSMLSKVCDLAKSDESPVPLFDFTLPTDAIKKSYVEQIQDFYVENSDDYFLNGKMEDLVNDNESAITIVNDIIERKPWSKVYESKYYPSNISITSKIDKEAISKIKKDLTSLITSCGIDYTKFNIDIMTDNAFKDISKTEIKLLEKQLDGSYDITSFERSGDKLDKYQSIKCYIRVFSHKSVKKQFTPELIKSIEATKQEILNNVTLIR